MDMWIVEGLHIRQMSNYLSVEEIDIFKINGDDDDDDISSRQNNMI